MRWPGIWMGCCLMLCLWPGAGNAACRQALVIGLDISDSVDEAEYRLQLDGLAGALLDADVQAAFLAMPDAYVRLFIYEWGGRANQTTLVPWTEIASARDLRGTASVLRAKERPAIRLATALGQAMLYGADALASQSDCWRRTMDLSGDGQSNSGPTPDMISGDAALVGVTINALVIGAESPPFSGKFEGEIKELSSYFFSEVIRGPEAFVQTAVGFTDFEQAMAKKLLKELQTRAVSALAAVDR